jgi:predicted RNase H-like nuclease
MKFVGVDGCRRGWFAAITDGGSSWDTGVFGSMKSLWAQHKNASLILVDIPIGLPFLKRRQCDVEARRLLGAKRSSSVFSAPSRAAAYAENFEAAKSANRRILGGALSVQAWGICRESHPEICFWALAGGRSMAHPKRAKEGIAERLDLVREINRECAKVYEEALAKYKRKGVARDDILDAIVLALTAGIRADLSRIPTEREEDEKGLVMEIVYKRRDTEAMPGSG